jgi:hypothetical protein
MSLQLRLRRAFILPILVGVIAVVSTMASVLMAALVSKLANFSNSAVCGVRARVAADAAISDLENSNLTTLFNDAACTTTPGMYVVPSSTCALPGAPGTIIQLDPADNTCNYSAKVLSLSPTSANILAIGRCTANECAGVSQAIVQVNTTVNGICTPSCNNVDCDVNDGCGGNCGCPVGLHCVAKKCL